MCKCVNVYIISLEFLKHTILLFLVWWWRWLSRWSRFLLPSKLALFALCVRRLRKLNHLITFTILIHITHAKEVTDEWQPSWIYIYLSLLHSSVYV